MSVRDKLNLSESPLYIVDGSAFFYRGFHAYPDLKRSDGFPTNALYIVLRVLLKVLKEEKPDYMVFLLDGKGKNFRHELFSDYKAQRPPMPDDLIAQVEPLKEAISLLGVPLIVSHGEEADDCIASFAGRFKGERPVIILGADKDLKQCLDDNVYMWDPAGRGDKITTLEDFCESTGLIPAQWADFQALVGDTADNIPGVPGVGKVTATKIMAKFPSLEDIRDNYDKLQPAVKKKIKDELENIFVYRELTRLKLNSCPEVTISDLEVQSPDAEGIAAYLNNYEFRSMVRDVAALAPKIKKSIPVAAVKKSGSPADGQLSLFGEGEAPSSVEKLKLNKISKSADLPDFSGKDVGLVWGKSGFIIGLDEDEFIADVSSADLASALGSAAIIATPDVKVLLRLDPSWKEISYGRWFDLGLAAYLLNPEDRNYGWSRLRSLVFHDENLSERTEKLHPDSEGQAALVLKEIFLPRIKAADLDKLMVELETPLIHVLAEMEEAGITIDLEAFSGFLDEVSAKITELTKEIYDKAGESFNIRSSQQMSTVLFENLGLKPAGKTPGGALSTANQVLEKLVGEHPVIADILEFRKMEKLRSTYLEPLPRMVDKENRIHTHFNQLATATGRLSSSGPNLQNIPIRGDFGKRMRTCFTAGKGLRLAAADYSQVELRVLAHFSGDSNLISAFEAGEDIHSRTAALLFEKDAGDVTGDERRNAKTINFGLIYGMGPQKLARELQISMNEAKEFINRYFEKLGTLKEFYDSVVEEARHKGYVTTLSGRRRLIPELHSESQQVLSQARRQAINTIIQGSAADIIKMAMIKVSDNLEIKELEGRLILQIHDELIVEGPEENIDKIGSLLQEDMQTVMQLSVPLKVDLGLGRNWAQAH